MLCGGRPGRFPAPSAVLGAVLEAASPLTVAVPFRMMTCTWATRPPNPKRPPFMITATSSSAPSHRLRRLGDAGAVHGHSRRAQGGAQRRRPLRRLPHGRGRVPRRRAPRGREQLVTNDVGKLADGHAMYTCACHPNGRHRRRSHRLPREAPSDFFIVVNAVQPRQRLRLVQSSRSKDRSATSSRPSPTRRRCSPSKARRRSRSCSSLTRLGRARGAQVVPLRDARPSPASRAPSRAPATPARTASRSSARTADAPQLWDALLDAGHDARAPALRPRRARHAAARGAPLPLRQRHRRATTRRTRPASAGSSSGQGLHRRAALAKQKAEGVTQQAGRLRDEGARHRAPRLPHRRDKTAQQHRRGDLGIAGPTVGKNIGLGYVPAALDVSRHAVSPSIAAARAPRAEVVKGPFYKRRA